MHERSHSFTPLRHVSAEKKRMFPESFESERITGNIQGGGQKFLGHLIRHFSHEYRQNHPNQVIQSEWTQQFQQKGSFIIFLSFDVQYFQTLDLDWVSRVTVHTY